MRFQQKVSAVNGWEAMEKMKFHFAAQGAQGLCQAEKP